MYIQYDSNSFHNFLGEHVNGNMYKWNSKNYAYMELYNYVSS